MLPRASPIASSTGIVSAPSAAADMPHAPAPPIDMSSAEEHPALRSHDAVPPTETDIDIAALRAGSKSSFEPKSGGLREGLLTLSRLWR